jgi:transcription-repair coupling factor (superfamily II helicase)
MGAGEVEERMSAFYEGKYEVLLSTTIVESGLDIPSANTIIIHRADRFRPCPALPAARAGRALEAARLCLSHHAATRF